VLEVKRGMGCYVRRRPEGVGSASVWLSWLATYRDRVLSTLEVTAALQAEAAALAARRASERGIARLQDAVERMSAVLSEREPTPDEALELDLSFHQALCEASGNPLLAHLAADVEAAMEAARRGIMTIPGRIERSYRAHRAILDAVRNRDSAAARQAVASHVQTLIEDYGTEALRARPGLPDEKDHAKRGASARHQSLKSPEDVTPD